MSTAWLWEYCDFDGVLKGRIRIGMKNAIGNVKPYDDVTAHSQCGVYCLDMSRGTHHSCMFLIGVILGNHVDEILTQPCRNRVQI